MVEKEVADARVHFWTEMAKLESNARKTREEIEAELVDVPPHMWGNRR